MIYKVIFTKRARREIDESRKSGAASFKKLKKMICELQEHPRTGIGHPELLKYELSGIWLREIDKKNRLTYTIDDNKVIVYVLTAIGHYNDK